MDTKNWILLAIGAMGAVITRLLGGWDTALQTLVGFMALDYLTGLVVAGVFRRSPKTKGGALSSRVGQQGIYRKVGMLAMVYIACQIDLLLGADYIRDTVVIALVVNETVSLIENFGLMGIPIPGPLKRAIDLLKDKEDNKK